MARRGFSVMIGDDGALIVPESGPPSFVGHDEDGAARCAALFSDASKASAHVVFDVRTQGLKREKLPPLTFFDRKKLLARRLCQAFPDAPLRVAVPFVAPNAWLFAALDETDVVSLWRERLARAGIVFKGILLAPLELASLLVRLEPKAADGWGLLLLSHKTGGFRQIVTLNGKTVFTRITPRLPPLAHVETIAKALAEDVRSTRLYLGRLGMAASAPLAFACVLAPSLKEAFYAAVRAKEPSALILSPYEAATRIGLNASVRPDEAEADLVSVLWLGRSGAKHVFVTSEQERAERKARYLARAGMLLAVCALVGALAYAASAALAATRLYERERAQALEIVSLRREFETLQKTAVETAENLERLRAAIEKRRFFTRENPSLADIVPLAAAIFEDASARVTELAWKDGVLSLDVALRNEESAASTARATQAQIQNRFDALAAALQEALPRHDVKISRYPFPSMPEETLTNKKDVAAEAVARFVLARRAP